MTKRLAAILLALAMTHGAGGGAASAAAPELLSYQGVLVQNSGIAVPDGVYDLRFRLYSQQTAGTPLFEQTLSSQVRHGLYNVILSNHAGYSLGEIVTQNPQLFMEVTVMANPALGVPADLTLLPRQQLASVPYALSQTESSPGIVEGALLRKASAQSPGPGWQTITGLDGLALEVPSAGCLLEVRAEVVLAGSDRVVGVQLEESAAGGAYAVVRGPVATRTQSDSKPDALALSHLLVEPATGTYTYRVRSRENSGSSYTVSPSLTNVGQTESTLSGKVICP